MPIILVYVQISFAVMILLPRPADKEDTTTLQFV